MPLVVWSPPRSSIRLVVRPGDEDFLAIGHAVAVLVVEDAEERRVQDPDFAVLGDQAARVLHLGEHGDVVDLAVAVLVDAAEDLAAAGRAAERTLLIHGDKHLAGRRDRQGYRIADLRRCGEQRDLEPRRRLDDVADRLVVDRFRRGAAAAAGRS